jgi:subtilisin family serine protease
MGTLTRIKGGLEVKFHLGFLAFLLAVPAQAALIDPSLGRFARERGIAAATVLVLMESRSEGIQVPDRYNRRKVVEYLRALNSRAATDLQNRVGRGEASRHVRIRELFWVNNSASVDVTAQGLRILAATPGIKKIYANGRVALINPVEKARGTLEATPYPYKETGLDELIRSNPRLDGSGVLIGHIDTGLDGRHPALRGKIAKYYDGENRRYTTPVDSDTHGTHTAGTIVGGDRSRIAIGVAPGAKLLASGPLAEFDGMLSSMQIMLDPDSNPATDDQPRAVSNSWHAPGAPDIELFYNAVGAWESAGILPIFAAGNSGPDRETIGHPQVHPVALVAGATGANGLITDFSSRGPGRYHDLVTQKPNLTAPGDNVNSSVPGGGYEEMSGTSMACPHVAGAAALLFQLDPRLSPEQMRKVLTQSTIPVDEAGRRLPRRGQWNAVYGLGKMHIPSAVRLAHAVKDARDALKFFLFSPDDQQIQDILKEERISVAEVLKFPSELEGTTWLRPEEL